MLYLFNDAVVEVDRISTLPPEVLRGIAGLNLDGLLGVVADMVRREPDFARSNPAKARRVAQMLLLRAPQMNAALILPAQDGRPGEARMLSLGVKIIHDLHHLHLAGALTLDLVRRDVWTPVSV